jgi:hypothetical protein
MKEKDIFELFTIQNHIKLTKEALKLLSSHDYDLLDILKEYKKLSKSPVVDIDILIRVIENRYSFHPFNYEYYSLISHYNFLRSKLKSVTNISDLVSHHGSTIQGIVYTNKQNDLVIEDSTGIIKIKGVKYKDIFITVYGTLIEDVFSVKDKEEDPAVINIKEGVPVNINSHKNILIYNTVCPKVLHSDTINILLNCPMHEDSKNTYVINHTIPVIFNLNNKKISLYNKQILNNYKDIPVYLDTYNYNFMNDHNLFYRDEYDIFILAGRTDHIEIYKEKIFVMIGQGNSALEISKDRLKFVEIESNM